jgi:hypothetical protein
VGLFIDVPFDEHVEPETSVEHGEQVKRDLRLNPKSRLGGKVDFGIGLRSTLTKGCPMPMVNVNVLESTLKGT